MKSMLEVLQTIPVYPEEITKRALFGQYVQDYRLPCDALLCEDGSWLSWISQDAKDSYLRKLAEKKARAEGRRAC